MREPKLLPIAESLVGLMPRLARGLASPEKDPANELSLAQLRLCGILSEGPRAMSVLSRELGVSLSALTQIADRLERARIVKRTAAVVDRRVRSLQLTSRGETMMRKRRDARLRRSVAVLKCLTSIQREQVVSAMETLVAACARMQEEASASPRRREPKTTSVATAANGSTAVNGNDVHGGKMHGGKMHGGKVNGNGHDKLAKPSRDR